MKIVENARNLPKKEFNDRMFKGYLESIMSAEGNNQLKTNGIRRGERFLTFALIGVALLVGFVLVSAGLQFISLS